MADEAGRCHLPEAEERGQRQHHPDQSERHPQQPEVRARYPSSLQASRVNHQVPTSRGVCGHGHPIGWLQAFSDPLSNSLESADTLIDQSVATVIKDSLMSFRNAVLALALTLFAVVSGSAQTASGTIAGKVLDAQGLPIPGTTVSVQGVDFTQTFITTEEGLYRFLDLAPGAYTLTAGLEGFSTAIHDRIVVNPGQTVDLRITLQISAVRERVTVTAPSPIVDAHQTGTVTDVSSDELSNIPTSGGPFSLLRSVSGVLVDRVNVGGNETGQQSNFTSKGTRPQDAVWTMDGVAITDMTLTGSSPTYF